MSFSASFEVEGGELLQDTFTSTNVTWPPPDETSEITTHDEIFYVVAGAVKEILDAEVLGTSDKRFRVTISGHGNKNHEPTAGWTNDFVTLNITQL